MLSERGVRRPWQEDDSGHLLSTLGTNFLPLCSPIVVFVGHRLRSFMGGCRECCNKTVGFASMLLTLSSYIRVLAGPSDWPLKDFIPGGE